MARLAPAPMDVARRVASFELRVQTRSPVFLVVVCISVLMVVGSLTVDRLQVGPLRPGNRTSAEAVLTVHLVWSLFFLFTAAAFAADAALRDETTRFGDVVRSTAAPPTSIAAGRLGAALAAVLLSFVSVPVATFLAPFAPWAAPMPIPDLSATAFGLFLLAIPNLVLACCLFFALAAAARSAMATYLGAVALLVLYGLGADRAGSPTPLVAMVEPFGFAAIRYATGDWGPPDQAVRLPPVGGVLAANRLLWLGVAIGATVLAIRWPRRSAAGMRPRQAEAGAPRPTSRSEAPLRRFDRRALVTQCAARTRLETGRVLRSPFLAVLLLLGLANVIGALAQLPAEAALVDATRRVDDAFRLVPIVVATFWAGELFWGERDAGLAEIVGAAPVPNSALLLPKVLALLLVLAASLCTAALAAASVEWWRTGTPEARAWLLGFALPRTWDAGLLAILAVFLQAIAPGKLAGFGLMVLFLIGSLALETMGFHGDLYRYGGASLSLDLAKVGSGHGLLVRAYWGAAALLLLLLATRMTSRSMTERVGARLRRAARGLGPRQSFAAGFMISVMGLLAALLAFGP